MIRQSDIELFNRVLDGLANADEQEEVRALLDRDSSARQYFDSLLLASTQLAKTERVVPPADLKTNVMAGIATSIAPGRVKERHSTEFFSYLRQQWNRSTSFNLAVGSLTGAAAVLIVVSVFSGSNQISQNSLQGTIGGNMSKHLVLTSGTVSAGHSSAQFDLTRSGKTLIVNVLVNSSDVSQVTLGFDQADLRLSSITASGSPIKPSTTENQLQFKATPGTAYQVKFEDKTEALSTLKLEITDDQLTARQEISTGSPTESE